MEPDLRDCFADTPMTRFWTYKLPSLLERRFGRETDANRNRQIRFWVAVGLAFCWLTFIVDLATIPDAGWLALLLRLCVVTPISLMAMHLLGAPRPRWQEALASVAPSTFALLTVMAGFAASASFDAFRSAVVLSIGILWMNVLIPIRFLDALTFTLVTLAIGDTINVTAVSLHHATIDYPEVITVTHMLVALSVLARFMAERESRRNFLVGLRLQIRSEELARSNEQLLEMSNTDALTGLANRRFFDRVLAQAWQTAADTASWIAVMMIDVDHFKLFNDAAGHLEGDRCLSIVARAIAEHVRVTHDLAARFGGEEFVVLMPALPLEQAHEIAERVRTAIAALQLYHPGQNGRAFVSVSIGVAATCAPAHASGPTELLRAADRALYAAKIAGRDRVM